MQKKNHNTRYDSGKHLPDWLLLLVALVMLTATIPGQASTSEAGSRFTDDETEDLRTIAFTYGLNLGSYFANNATANYYNGSGRHSLESALNRQHNYNRIRESLGYDFELHGLPLSMSYSPAILVGVFGTIQIGKRTAIHGEFNFARLRLDDQFTLELDKPSFIEGDNVVRYPLSGVEERSEIQLGIQHTTIIPGGTIHPFVEGGVSLVNTRVRENRARIEGQSYSIRNISDTHYDFRDDGIGMGGYASLGLRMDLGDSYALALGGGTRYSMIRLGEVYEGYYFNYTLFVRLFLSQ